MKIKINCGHWHLTNTLHGAANLGGNPEELAEIPARHLHHTVVQTRLKVGCCRVGNGVPTENTFTDFSLPRNYEGFKKEILKQTEQEESQHT